MSDFITGGLTELGIIVSLNGLLKVTLTELAMERAVVGVVVDRIRDC